MSLPIGQIVKGDAPEVLRTFPAESVQYVVTSPPYWGLRDYGEPGQGGLEATPEAHVEWIVGVMREVRRVLRSDGVLWLNYGDCYFAGGWECQRQNKIGAGSMPSEKRKSGKRAPGLKPKDLVGMPWRVAFALQADGWWLRSDVIWAKPNPMPESVTDRPTSAHEHVYLLAKSARYFYDAEAVRVPMAESSLARINQRNFENQTGGAKDYGEGSNRSARKALENLAKRDKQRGHRRRHAGFNDRWDAMEKAEQMTGGANLRNVWNIATQPYPGAHFATFPQKLVEPCIKAGPFLAGACPTCGAPWRREVEIKDSNGRLGSDWNDQKDRLGRGQHGCPPGSGSPERYTTGWSPGCECDAGDPTPCIVMDPFAGSGTVGIVCARLGREFVGIDLAGGDKDLGGYTAHERIEAAKEGRPLAEWLGHRAVGQTDLLDGLT